MKLRIHKIALIAVLILVGAFTLTQQAAATGTQKEATFEDKLLILSFACAAGYQGECNVECPRSPGYWMNHPEAWPQEQELDPCIVDYFIGLMKQPVKGNKVLTLLPALIAAELNIYYCGYDDDLGYLVDAAIIWTFENWNRGEGVRANSPEWQNRGQYILFFLEAYNNGIFY